LLLVFWGGIHLYRIVQVLNNNIAIVKKDGKQEIAMGKGLVFQKKKGDLIAESDIKNLFVLKNEESKENISLLLKDIPLDYITTAYEIIENAIIKYDYSVQEYIYVTLTDHLYWNSKRLRKGEYIESFLPDIREQYPVEYQIAKDALEMIESKLGLVFPESELKNLSIHFINAQAKTDNDSNFSKNKINEQNIMHQVEIILKEKNISRSKENQNFYDRLMIHLRYMLERNGQETDDSFAEKMEESLKKEYPKAFEIAEEIYQEISEKTGFDLKSSEKVYFTIHLQRIL